MRNTYTLLGLSFLIVIIGTVYAFNRGSTPSAGGAADTNTINSSPKSMTSLSLSSSAFPYEGTIPSQFTCDANSPAGGISPSLQISGVPDGTKTLALLMDDPDIPQVFKTERGIDSFDHWTLFNIPPDTKEIAQGEAAGITGSNGAGKSGYIGPCPPREYEPSEHRYYFRLYALDAELSLQAGASKTQVLKAMEGHIIAQVELIGRYKRP